MANIFLKGFRDHIVKNPGDPVKDKWWLNWIDRMIDGELPRVQISMQHREGAEVALDLRGFDVEEWITNNLGG